MCKGTPNMTIAHLLNTLLAFGGFGAACLLGGALAYALMHMAKDEGLVGAKGLN